MDSRDYRIAGTYFAAQGIGVVVWWIFLLSRPDLRGPFFAPQADTMALTKFLVPDVLVVGGTSLVAATLILRRSKFGRLAAWAAVGAVTYALGGALAVNWPIGTRPWADGIMILSMLGTLWSATRVNG